jgi:hypothetical protein
MVNFTLEFKDLTNEEFDNITEILSYLKDNRTRKLIPKDQVSIHTKAEILRYLDNLIPRMSHEDIDAVHLLFKDKEKREQELFGGI